jgi:Uma2 family endonuclease
MEPARKLATFDDLLALPEDVRGEIFDGEVVVQPPPGAEHGRGQVALDRTLGGPFDHQHGRGGPGGWWILTEVDVALPGVIVRPDLVGWRRERLPDPWSARPITVVPDWIAEVVSPSNASTDRVRKRRVYASAGVAHYWLLDPGARTLEVLALQGSTWVEVGAYEEGDVVRLPPFEAVEIEVALLFPPRPASAG